MTSVAAIGRGSCPVKGYGAPVARSTPRARKTKALVSFCSITLHQGVGPTYAGQSKSCQPILVLILAPQFS